MANSLSSQKNAAAPSSIESFDRIVGVLFHPKSTFEAIVAQPTWVLPIALACLVSTATAGIFSLRVGWHSYLERAISKNSSAQYHIDASRPQLREKVVAHEANVLSVAAYAGAIAGLPVMLAIVAAVLLGVFSLFAETKISFPISFAILAYSWVPWILRGLIGLNIVSFRDPSSISLTVRVPSIPAVFLPRGSPLWLFSLLGSLDIFSIWTMILMAIGYCAVDPKKVSFSKALAIIVGVWGLYATLKVGLFATLGVLIHSLG